jgi:hypothetical protein
MERHGDQLYRYDPNDGLWKVCYPSEVGGPFNSSTILVPILEKKVLNIITKEVRERTAEDRFTYTLNAAYDPNADQTEINNYMDSLIRKPDQKLLKRFLWERLGEGSDRTDLIIVDSDEEATLVILIYRLMYGIVRVYSPGVSISYLSDPRFNLMSGMDLDIYLEEKGKLPTLFIGKLGYLIGSENKFGLIPRGNKDPVPLPKDPNALLNWILI